MMLDHDHQKRAQQHYQKLETNAVHLPSFKKKRNTVNDILVQKGRERFEAKKMAELKLQLQEQNKLAVREKYAVTGVDKTTREYPKRFIYFVVDGQDVLNSPNFLFSHIEVNDRLNTFIS